MRYNKEKGKENGQACSTSVQSSVQWFCALRTQQKKIAPMQKWTLSKEKVDWQVCSMQPAETRADGQHGTFLYQNSTCRYSTGRGQTHSYFISNEFNSCGAIGNQFRFISSYTAYICYFWCVCLGHMNTLNVIIYHNMIFCASLFAARLS